MEHFEGLKPRRADFFNVYFIQAAIDPLQAMFHSVRERVTNNPIIPRANHHVETTF